MTSLMPREHGAYGQMVFPLLTAWLVSGGSIPTAAWTSAVVAGFLVHESLLVLLGHRGTRARRERGRQAGLAAALLGGIATASTLLAVVSTPAGARWAFAVPAVPALALAAAVAMRREKSTFGEVAVALTFSFAAVPAVHSAGAPVAVSFVVALVFSVIFVVSTLAVRSVILGVRGGGNPRAVRATRIAGATVCLCAVVGFWIASSNELLPWTSIAAVAPAIAFALAVTVRPPRAAALSMLGWCIAAVTTLAAAMLAVALARG